MMTIKFLSPKLLLLLLFLVAPVFGNDEFKLNLPRGWEEIRDPSQLPAKVVALYIGKKNGQFTPSINLARETTDLDAKAYADLAKEYHENLPETSCRSLGTLTISGNEAHLFQIDRPTSWGGLRFLQATFVEGNTAYVITATAQVSEYASLYPQFYEAISTFSPPKANESS